MDFNFEITNDANIKMVFDELLGDKIEAAGHGMLVPAQTPDSAIAILNKAITKALNTPEVKSVLSRQGIYSNPTDPKSFGAFIDSEALKWGNVVKSAKIKK